MRRRAVVLLLTILLVGAATPTSGRATIESLNQPPVPGDMGWCIGDCEVLEFGNHKAVVKFQLEPAGQTGTLTYVDHGVRYAGRPFAIEGAITGVTYWSDPTGSGAFGWHLVGSYEPRSAMNVPAGALQVWLDSGPTWTYVTVYLSDFTVPFSYLNQGMASHADVPILDG